MCVYKMKFSDMHVPSRNLFFSCIAVSWTFSPMVKILLRTASYDTSSFLYLNGNSTARPVNSDNKMIVL